MSIDGSFDQSQSQPMDVSSSAKEEHLSPVTSSFRPRVNSNEEESAKAPFSIKITPTEVIGAAQQESGTAASKDDSPILEDSSSAAESSTTAGAEKVAELEALLIEVREFADKESARADQAQNEAWRELSKDVTTAKELAAATEAKLVVAEKKAVAAEKRVTVLEAEAKEKGVSATVKGASTTEELEGLRRKLETSEAKCVKGEASLAEERRNRGTAERELEDATKRWAVEKGHLEERVPAKQMGPRSESDNSNETVGSSSSADEEEWDAKVQAVKDMLAQVKGYLHNQGDLVRKMQKSLE
jgi:hypothetical protein